MQRHGLENEYKIRRPADDLERDKEEVFRELYGDAASDRLPLQKLREAAFERVSTVFCRCAGRCCRPWR